jgi:uncharacterized protein YdhG (YjbR/CyaY superfamily)
MTKLSDIDKFNNQLDDVSRDIADVLRTLIDGSLTKAESKVWHGAPVWFLDGNPIVGYSKKKKGFELLFWSGQSFEENDLTSSGNFKAARITFTNATEIKKTNINKMLRKSKSIQWDYANLPKNKKLVKLTEF